MPYKRMLLGLAGLFLQSCFSSPADMLTGTWQVDSVYYYYNGFDYRSTLQAPETYQYAPEGTVLATHQQHESSYHYVIKEDQLEYRNEQGELLNQYQILRLNREQLILRKEKEPFFLGGEQLRYEIRYFSKVDLF